MRFWTSGAIVCLMVTGTLILTSCGQGSQAAEQQSAGGRQSLNASPAASIIPRSSGAATPAQIEKNPIPAAKTVPGPTPIFKQPALTTTNISLSLSNDQEYTEYTLPIYIKMGQRLHFYWTVTTGGDHLSLAFTTPDGELVSVQNDGALARNASSVYPDEKLYFNGNIVFTPVQNGWIDGYYIFQPHIRKGDAAIGGKIYYWIEN